MKCWTVYCHTHIESERRYIGITSRTMERRWSQHVTQSKSSKGGRWHFPNAIRKYGPEAFGHEVWKKCLTLEIANAYEEYFIDLFRTRDPECGFNLAKGGVHRPHPIRKNPWDDPEFRAKQLASSERLRRDPAFIAKCASASRTFWSNPNSLIAVKDPVYKFNRSMASRKMWDEISAKRPKTPKTPKTAVSVSRPVQILEGKLCGRCGNTGEFGKDRHNKSEFKCVCKACEKIARKRPNATQLRQLRQKISQRRNRGKIKLYQAEYYAINKDRIRQRASSSKEAIRDRSTAWRTSVRSMVDDAKNKPCNDCNHTFNPSEMEFFTPDLKARSIEWMINYRRPKDAIVEEMRSRVLVCRGCWVKRMTSC